ncbi:WSC domain-containing protein [Crassisporium funariophilum]|nr:WSC domain-containing protein [Crassisporium funariophilum]
MTLESCAAFCTPAGYQYAGLEFGRQDCDNTIESPGAPAMDGCNMACTGNSVELCGGADRISILNRQPTVGTFQYKGCFQDGVNGAPRSLLNKVTVPGGVSAESCTTACKSMGYPLAGLEFGRECWCDTYMALAVHAPDSDCDKACEADSTEICGSGNRLTVYHDTIASPPDVQECLHNAQFSAFRFNLQAVPNAGGGAPVPIGTLELTARSGEPTFFVLSVRPLMYAEMFTMKTDLSENRPDGSSFWRNLHIHTFR